MASDTKQRIIAAARELFAQKGVQKTSLQEIADRLDITKPALYYHFTSREELLRAIVQPMIDDGARFIDEHERSGAGPRELIEGFFDFNYAHRADVPLILAEMSTLVELNLIDVVLAWRGRLAELLFGPAPTLEQSVRAVMTLGGIQDCTMQLGDAPVAELRAATVAAAMATLGLD